MANTQAVANSFKTEVLNGIHAFGTTVTRGATTADVFKAALFLASATINASTATYSTTGEVTGAGYTAGGVTFTWTAVANTPPTSYTTPSASFSWSTTTLSTSFDCVLLYNSTQGNKAVAAYTFGATTVTAGNFSITMPANAAATALLRLA